MPEVNTITEWWRHNWEHVIEAVINPLGPSTILWYQEKAIANTQRQQALKSGNINAIRYWTQGLDTKTPPFATYAMDRDIQWNVQAVTISVFVAVCVAAILMG